MTVHLATIPESDYPAWVAGYTEGVAYGVARAQDDVEAADDAAFAELSRTFLAQARSPRFSQLCEPRGETLKSARARELERHGGLDLA